MTVFFADIFKMHVCGNEPDNPRQQEYLAKYEEDLPRMKTDGHINEYLNAYGVTFDELTQMVYSMLEDKSHYGDPDRESLDDDLNTTIPIRGDGWTGIEERRNEGEKVSGWFTLQGLRINEPVQKGIWAKAGAASPEKRLVSFTDRMDGDVRKVAAVTDYALSGTVYRVSAEWTIRDGAAKVRAVFTQSGNKFEPAHIGFRTELVDSGLDVEWLGRGPWENYSDRKSGAFIGLWRLGSEDFFFPYDVPQDCGNREDAYRVKLSGLMDSVTFEACGQPFAFEVNPYSPETLVKYAHPAELPPSDSTYFGIWAKSRGLGGNSCGPLPLERDRIGEEPYTLEFTVR